MALQNISMMQSHPMNEYLRHLEKKRTRLELIVENAWKFFLNKRERSVDKVDENHRPKKFD